MASAVQSFPPLLGERPRILVLGSMPGAASLEAGAYYAHPRNAFWPIVLAWLDGTAPDRGSALRLPYAERCRRLLDGRIALWDVLARCERPGSLDSAIVRTSERPNAIANLLDDMPTIGRIVFNGRTAERAFERHIVPALAGLPAKRVARMAAPSTSPAMAALSLDAKHAAWSAALGPSSPSAPGAGID